MTDKDIAGERKLITNTFGVNDYIQAKPGERIETFCGFMIELTTRRDQCLWGMFNDVHLCFFPRTDNIEEHIKAYYEVFEGNKT